MSADKRIKVKIGGEEKTLEIQDDTHLWWGGEQYISLSRMYEVKKDMAEEMRLLNNKVIELTDQNEAYRLLLRDLLNEGK